MSGRVSVAPGSEHSHSDSFSLLSSSSYLSLSLSRSLSTKGRLLSQDNDLSQPNKKQQAGQGLLDSSCHGVVGDYDLMSKCEY